MSQNINKGNIYQAAKRANLTPQQTQKINSLTDMYSQHVRLNNLPPSVGAAEYNQLPIDQQKAQADFFGGIDDTDPKRGFIGQAAYIISRPVVEPIKAVFKAAGWASDQVTRAYRVGAIGISEGVDLGDAFQRSGANGEQVFNPGRIEKVEKTYGRDRTNIAKKISAGIPLDQIIREAQTENEKALAFAAGSKEGDKLTEEAVAKVNAAKYSPGRQVANAFLPDDLEGKSGLYSWISGTTDAAFRIVLDPTILLGKARKGYLGMKYALDKTVGTAEKVEDAFKNRNIENFWTEFTKTTKDLRDARIANNAEKIGQATGRLRALNPAFAENGVDSALIKFANEDFGGILDVNTAKAFLSNAQRIEPIFYGQPGFRTKVMPILSPARKAKLAVYDKAGAVFDLNTDSANFLRNIVFDEADAQGISSLEAARRSLLGREGESAVAAGARTAERITKAESEQKLARFSIAGINKRLDNFTRKFALIPDMDELGNFASEKSALAFERYARLVYGRYSSRILGDAYKQANIGQRREMFIGLQSAVGELRGLRGTQGGRKLLESLGAVGRDAVYTNRAITPDNPDGVIPSQINGVDSAAYAYQLNDRLAFITPEQLDKFGARDGFLAKAWGMQYSKAADDAVSTFVTGTLAGPRFPLRNAIEDYLFGLANGRGVIRSAKDIVKARGVAKKVIQASEDLNFAVLNRYAKAKDKDNLLARMNAIDSGSELRWNATTKTWDKVDDVFKSPAKKEEAKRKVMAEALLRENFNDAQMGKFGSDFDRYAYEFAMYGDYENLLKGASEGAYNLNAGNDFFSRAKRLSRKHGKVVDFEVDGEAYKRAYGSFTELSPLSQEGRLAWAFQIAAKANDEIGSAGLKLLAEYKGDRTGFINAFAKIIDTDPKIASLKPRFDRYVDETYTSQQHAAVIYDDLATMLGKADGSINDDLLNKLVTLKDDGDYAINMKEFSLEWLPKGRADVPATITGPLFIPATQSKNIISDLNTRLWDWLGDANARLSRDQLVLDAAFDIRKDLQPFLDDLSKKVGEKAATQQIIEMSQNLAIERVMAFVDNPAVRTQMAWSMRNFARFYRATEDAYRRAYRTVKYNPEALQKIALTYEGVSHSGFVQRDDQGEAYFIYPGLAPAYGAVNKMLNVFGLGDKFVAPMPLQFGSSLKMLTPSANPDSWLPTFSGPLSGLTLKTIYNIAGFFSESDIPVMAKVAKEIKSTEQYTIGEIGEGQSFFQSALPGHVNRLLATLDKDERDSQYASAFRKAVTYLEAGGHTPSATATPGELIEYQKRLKSTITAILGTRFVLGFISPASPTTTLKSDMADWVRDNGRVNFKQVFSKLIDQYSDTNDPVGNAMADWVKYYPEQVPYVINESDPVFQARVKTSNAAANWVDDNSELIKKYPEGAAFLIPQSGTFSWEAYQFLKDNGYRETKLVGDFLKETFVAKSKQFYYIQRDKYEEALQNVRTDRERKQLNEAWDAWSREFKQTRPLLQEEFANSAANNVKRMAAYKDLKTMLDETKIVSPAANAIRKMVQLYDDYKLQIDTVYNSRSEADINAREILRTATLAEMQDIADSNPNASGVYDILFSNFLRGD
jgi:hypothetical protein